MTSIVDRLVQRHAVEIEQGRTPSRWRFTPETYAEVLRECNGLAAQGCQDVSPTSFLGLPFEVGPIAYNQPFTLD